MSTHRPQVSDVLLPAPGAPRRARNVVTQACLQWEIPHLVAAACLVVTELVTNVLVHTHTMADLRVVLGRRYLLILVCDGAPGVPVMPAPAVLDTDRTQPGLSRGLMLIDVTANRWGYRHLDGGKVVWAALHLALPR